MSAENISITLTPQALDYLRKKLINRPDDGLKIGIKKSGCSGWLYTFEYKQQPNQGESTFLIERIKFFIHHDHLNLFKGAIIHYARTGLNGNLTCINPNEGARCGCGESFSLEETTV